MVEQRRRDSEKDWKRLSLVLLGLITGLAAFINSELVEGLARPGIQQLSDWVIALGESVGIGGPGSISRPATAVVMISDIDMPEMADAWPLPVPAYTRFIQRAWCLGAGGVFLDIGMPSYPKLGSPDPNDKLGRQDLNDRAWMEFKDNIYKFARTIEAPPECPSWGRRSASAPEKMPVLLSEQYNEELRHIASAKIGLTYVSAIVGADNLYLSHSPTDRKSGAQLRSAACETANLLGRSDGAGNQPCPIAFEVRDTSLTPAEQQNFTLAGSDEDACLYRGKTLSLQQVLSFVKAFFSGLFHTRSNWRDCPPVLTVPWSAMFDPFQAAIVSKVLEGRMLMVSASLAGVSDNVRTNLHNELPGVYLHALATESMMSVLGPANPAIWHDRLALLVLGSLTVFASVSWRHKALPMRFSHVRHPRVVESDMVFIERSEGLVTPATRGNQAGNRELQPELASAESGLFRAEAITVATRDAETRTRASSDSAEESGDIMKTAAARRILKIVCVVLLLCYALAGWQVSVTMRDLLFFWICHTDELWWLDVTKMLDRILGQLKANLPIG